MFLYDSEMRHPALKMVQGVSEISVKNEHSSIPTLLTHRDKHLLSLGEYPGGAQVAEEIIDAFGTIAYAKGDESFSVGGLHHSNNLSPRAINPGVTPL